MDESYSTKNKISSLTALVVPVEVYAKARSDFYEGLQWAIQPSKGVIGNAPELHGSNFLRAEGDERKFEVLRNIVKLISANNLKIYRVGYYITPSIEEKFPFDKNLLELCWFSLLSMMEPEYEERVIVPIMDGLDSTIARKFSRLVKGQDEKRTTRLASSGTVKNSQNIFGEVFYSDSQYSAFTQVADIVSYVRHIEDLKSEKKHISHFKKSLSEIAETLKDCIAWEEIISLNLNHQIQGPKQNAKMPYQERGPITACFDIIPSDSEDIRFPHKTKSSQ